MAVTAYLSQKHLTWYNVALRPIYTVQLCRMRYAYDKSTTRVVPCKSNLQLACDCRVRHGECRELLKHVLKPYDNRSNRRFDIVEIVYDFSMMRAAHAFVLLILLDIRRRYMLTFLCRVPQLFSTDDRKCGSNRANKPSLHDNDNAETDSEILLW